MNLVTLSSREPSIISNSLKTSPSNSPDKIKYKGSNFSSRQSSYVKLKTEQNDISEQFDSPLKTSPNKRSSMNYPSAPILKNKKYVANKNIFRPDLKNKNGLMSLTSIKNFTESTMDSRGKLSPIKYNSDKVNKAKKQVSVSQTKLSQFSKDLTSPRLTIETDENTTTESQRVTRLSLLPQINSTKTPKLKRLERSEEYKKFFHTKRDGEDKFYQVLLDKEENELDERFLRRNYSELKLYETYKELDKLKYTISEEFHKNPVTAMLATSHDKNLLPRTFGMIQRKDEKFVKVKLR